MTARFTKLPSTDDPDTEPESDPEEGIMGLGKEQEQVQLILDDVVGDTRVSRRKPLRACRRKCRCCSWVNSWRMILIAVVVFSTAITISLIVARLVPEPKTPYGAVATDVPWCSEMAAEILEKKGSAVDAAITALLCVGAVHAESSGIGGGGFMVIRDTNGSVYAINFREAAPMAATVDVFHSNGTLSEIGGLAVAVPGELRGMEMAHSMFGRLPWYDLFEPVIEMCREGFNITSHTEEAVEERAEYLLRSDLFRQIYFTSEGEPKKEGEVIKRPILADTLEQIARNGAGKFYSGSIAQSIVQEVQRNGGILTLEDLVAYEARLEEPLQVNYSGHIVYSHPVPCGGPELVFSLGVLDGYQLSPNDSSQGLAYHRLVEAFKFAFALRSQLGDPNCEGCGSEEVLETQANMTSEAYAAGIRALISDDQTFDIPHYHAHFDPPPSDDGTTHISVLGPDGQAVSVTSTINTYFGSKLITETGIVLNNEMDDFSSPNITNAFGVRPSEANYILPGKRPLSSTSPAIIVRVNGGSSEPVLVIGASGGTRIPTATTQAILRVLSFKEPLKDAIEARRLHHQLSPNEVRVEEHFPEDIVQSLQSKGHSVSNSSSYAVVQGVLVNSTGGVSAHSDSRKQGQASIVGVV